MASNLYSLADMRRNSTNALAGYRRRRQSEPDIDSEALRDSIARLMTIWSIFASVALLNVSIAYTFV